MTCRIARTTPLFDAPRGERVIDLNAGDTFELLELAGDHAWGTAQPAGLVGYCDRTALELA